MVLVLILLPLFSGLFVGLLAPRRFLGGAAAFAMLVTAVLALWAAFRGSQADLLWVGPLELTLAATGAAKIVGVLVPLVAAPIVAFATWEYAEDPGLRRMVGLLLGFVGAMELLVMANDLLSLIFGWELVAAFSWALIGQNWRVPRAPEAAGEAYLTVRLGGFGLPVAAAAVFASVGSVAYTAMGGVGRPWLDIAAAGVLLAAATKSAQVPFGQWLFAAMEGPAPVSALLHSATMVAGGVYALIRLESYFAPLPWFGPTVIVIGFLGAFLGGAIAMLQTDFKRVLAGSTTAQYGLMFIAVGVSSTTAATAQLLTHAFFKSLLFLGAGVALATAGTGHLGRLRLGSRRRAIALLFGIGVFALAALPPLGGGFSKESIFVAALHYSWWVGALVLVTGVTTAFYAIRLFALSFGRPDGGGGTAEGPGGGARPPERRRWRRMPSTEVWTMAVLAAASVFLGVLRVPAVWSGLTRLTTASVTEEHVWQLAVSVATVGAAVAVVGVLRRRGVLLNLGLPSGLHGRLADWFGAFALIKVAIVRPLDVVAAGLRTVDDRLIDASIGGLVRSTVSLARTMSAFDRRVVDAIVEASAALGIRAASVSRSADDAGVDGAVEGTARGSWWAGTQARRLQTGLSHHYYVIVAIGVVISIGFAAWRS